MSDLEVYGDEERSVFAGLPNPADLKIDHWSEPDEHGTQYLVHPPTHLE